MGIAFVAGTEAGSSSASSLSVTYASTTAGHLLLLTIGWTSSSVDVKRRELVAAGWRQLVDDWAYNGSVYSCLAVWWKIADGSESGSLTVKFYSGSSSLNLGMAAWSGVDATYPIADSKYLVDNSADYNVDVPALYCALDGSKAVHVYSNYGANEPGFSPVSGFTTRLTAAASGVRPSIGVADKDVDLGSVASGSGGATYSGIDVGVTLLLNPNYANALHCTPWKYPGTLTNQSATELGLADGTDWTTPSNAGASDDTRSEVGSTAPTLFFDSDLLKGVGFGFSIPPGAVVSGIEIEVEGRFYFTSATTGDATRIVQMNHGLYRAGTVESYITLSHRAFEGIYESSPSGSSPADDVYTIGGPGCMWGGASWSKSDVESSTFGCYAMAQLSSPEDPSAGSNEMQIDGMRMRVWFTPPPMMGDIP